MEKNYNKYFPLFVLPTLVAFSVIFVVPFLMGVFLSFTDFSVVNNWEWSGISNYINAFTFDRGFLTALTFTVKFTVVSVVTVNVFAFLIALALTRGIRGSDIFRTVFFMPNLIGGIVLGYIWNLIINGILGYAGVDITFSARYGFWGLVVLMNWQMIGYMMVIYIAGLQNVPKELIEAASIDGANAFSRLKFIILPVLKPSITICTFLTLTNSFKLFDQNLALTGGAPAGETSMIALDIYRTFYGRTGWQGVGQAKAVVFFVILALISLVQLKATSGREAKR